MSFFDLEALNRHIEQMVEKQVNESMTAFIEGSFQGMIEHVASTKKMVLTVDETAEYMGLSPRTVRELAQRRKISSYKEGRRIYFKHEDVERYCTRNGRRSAAEIKQFADRILKNPKKVS